MEPLRFKVCLCGTTAVGKTSLINRALFLMNDKPVPPVTATIGMDMRQMTVDDPIAGLVEIMLYDTAGQERAMETIAPVYWRNASAIVFVYDLTTATSYDAMETWLSQAQKNLGTGADPFVLVVGNKLDLATTSRSVPTGSARSKCDALNYAFIETSAETGSNVTEAFTEIVRALVKRSGARKPCAADKPSRPAVTLQTSTSIPITDAGRSGAPAQASGMACQC